MSAQVPAALLEASLRRKAHESAELLERFIDDRAPSLVECARAMAAAFDAGGRLFTFGNGGSACDAQHLALEHVHPILEKRPPLPALALGADASLLTAVGNDRDFALVFAEQLRMHGRPGDVALGISSSGKSANVNRALGAARELGLLTVGFTGKDGGKMAALCDHSFVVPSFSIHRIQEVHASLIHLLWDTVHLVRGQDDVL